MKYACMPACLSCEKAGECEKTWKRKDLETRGFRKAISRKAQAAAIEKSKAGYIHLNCGCLTTVEEQETYAYWRPKGKHVYCPNGHGWREAPKKKKPVTYPDVPLF